MSELTILVPESRFTLDGVLSAEECAETIAWAEGVGFEEAPVTTPMGFLKLPHVRNNRRVMVDAPERAEEIWRRVAEHVPAELGPWRACGLNERLRIYRYEPGQFFRAHFDGCFQRDSHEKSFFTFMVYLNDDFTGGATSFGRQLVTPVAGRALCFLHRQRHQGDTVESGVKYALRTDVMYRRLA